MTRFRISQGAADLPRRGRPLLGAALALVMMVAVGTCAILFVVRGLLGEEQRDAPALAAVDGDLHLDAALRLRTRALDAKLDRDRDPDHHLGHREAELGEVAGARRHAHDGDPARPAGREAQAPRRPRVTRR